MIDVARIDHWAASGTGRFHRASTASKLLFVCLVVGSAVAAKNPYPLMTGYAVILLMVAFSGMPWGRMILLSSYALVFAFLYGFSLGGGLMTYGLLTFKAVTPALAVLALIMSTPYPRIFSLFSMVLPEILAAGLFMTYRTLFILLEMMDNFAAAIRLRGGFAPGDLVRNSRNIAKGIAMLVVKAVERSQRVYAVMAVRGYSGSMAQKGMDPIRPDDWLPVGTGIIVLVLSIAWK